jgi:hypothetical protein
MGSFDQKTFGGTGCWGFRCGPLLGVLVGVLALASVAGGAPLPGQIVADPAAPQYLRCVGGGPFFVCGPGDPEDFLYRGALLPDGTRDGDQQALVRRLLELGGNCLYVQAVRSHGGDGSADHNPFLNHDPTQGVNPVVLDQWETWFSLLDDHGVLIYFFFYDDSADPWKTGDEVGAAEQDFVATLVRRFQRYRHLIWVVAEESEEALSPARAERLAEIIREADEHAHLIGNHHHSGTRFKSYRAGGPFDHFAVQLNVPADETYAAARAAVREANGRYSLIYAENTATPQTVEGWRRQAWRSALAGAMPMLLGMDVVDTPDEALRQCRILAEFFEDTDYYAMQPGSPASAGGDDSAPLTLVRPGMSFVAWAAAAGARLEVDGLAAGRYELLWLDCLTGRRVEAAADVPGEVGSLTRPQSIGPECAVYGRRDVPGTAGGVPATFPAAQWEIRRPADAGLDEAALAEFARLAGGRGCVVREGAIVFSWGDAARPGDLASAGKPLYSHLLFRALETGRLESADDLVVDYLHCLRDLNPDLDFKDRRLTFRHLAFQTACMGCREAPGTAYDYNDHTMGLFWDVLVNEVFDCSWVEAPRLFEQELSGPLQFEDEVRMPLEGRQRGRVALSPRDFARVGWLYLNEGRWRDRQVLAARHARLAASDPLSLNVPRTAAEPAEGCGTRSIGGGGNQTDHHGGYSWLWWVNAPARDGRRWWADAPADMFCALGHCGQRGLAVLPTERMVVSWNDAAELHCDRELGSRAFAQLVAALVREPLE